MRIEPEQANIFGTSDRVRLSPLGKVADNFLFTPLSIQRATSSEWINRKRAWISLGIKSDLGRNVKANPDINNFTAPSINPDTYTQTSVFDPVLCELLYTWFCVPGGQIVDPFAGGSVRGIVAHYLGYRYWGCDLSREQIDANVDQAKAIGVSPVWVCGDSIDALAEAPSADMIIACPPYGDLEVYSDDPRDLSTMEWHTFSAAYKRIVLRCAQKMKDNTFACFIVSNFRDKDGFYRDLCGLTTQAFADQGIGLYNDGILATSLGNAALRVTRQFNASRKFVRVHQNILIYLKGDYRANRWWRLG